MMIYFIVFISVSLIIVSATRTTNQKGFSQTKSNVAILSEDNSSLVDGLKNSLHDMANFVELDGENAVQDALYFRRAVYIIRIPKDFTQKFLAGESVKLEKTTVPNSIESIYINLKVEQYLRLARLYSETSSMDEATIVENVLKDMDVQTKVDLLRDDTVVKDQSYSVYFHNYMAYSLFCVLIFGISTVMLVFNETDIRRRNLCSPVKMGSMNFQFYLANITFSVICWALFIFFCWIFNIKNSETSNTLLFMLNSFVFTICAASISFLIGNLAKNRQAISALANVVALGSSFVSGVFVPQSMIGASVLKFASFFPTYWYVKGNNLIGQMGIITKGSLNEVFGYIGIEIGFTIAFIALALVVGRQKQLGVEM